MILNGYIPLEVYIRKQWRARARGSILVPDGAGLGLGLIASDLQVLVVLVLACFSLHASGQQTGSAFKLNSRMSFCQLSSEETV